MREDKVVQARLLRAKARFVANLRVAAHQGTTAAVFGFKEALSLTI